MQRYLASMEGAVLSGKLTAQAIAQDDAAGLTPVAASAAKVIEAA